MQSELGSGRTLTTVLFSIVVEEESTKISDLNFRTTCIRGDNGEILSQTVTSFCSCDVQWGRDGIGSSSCWHVKCFRENGYVFRLVSGVMDEASTRTEVSTMEI